MASVDLDLRWRSPCEEYRESFMQVLSWAVLLDNLHRKSPSKSSNHADNRQRPAWIGLRLHSCSGIKLAGNIAPERTTSRDAEEVGGEVLYGGTWPKDSFRRPAKSGAEVPLLVPCSFVFCFVPVHHQSATSIRYHFGNYITFFTVFESSN